MHLECGDAQECIRLLEQGLADWDATSAALFRPYYKSRLAVAYAQVGQVEMAEDALVEAAGAAKDTCEIWCEGEILRLYRELLYTFKCDKKNAESKFRGSLDLARDQGGRSWKLRAAMSLARLWRDRGETARAIGSFTPDNRRSLSKWPQMAGFGGETVVSSQGA